MIFVGTARGTGQRAQGTWARLVGSTVRKVIDEGSETVGKGEGMRLYKLDEATNTVDLGQVEILFYHGRPVAFKDFDSKILYAMTETVSSDMTFRKDFKKSWSGKFEVTGGQAELEGKIREALRDR